MTHDQIRKCFDRAKLVKFLTRAKAEKSKTEPYSRAFNIWSGKVNSTLNQIDIIDDAVKAALATKVAVSPAEPLPSYRRETVAARALRKLFLDNALTDNDVNSFHNCMLVLETNGILLDQRA